MSRAEKNKTKKVKKTKRRKKMVEADMKIATLNKHVLSVCTLLLKAYTIPEI